MRRAPRARRAAASKLAWNGTLTSVQPRIRLNRSFDQRSHTYQGYVLRVDGMIGDDQREFLVAIGEGAQAKHGFAVGDTVSGEGSGGWSVRASPTGCRTPTSWWTRSRPPPEPARS